MHELFIAQSIVESIKKSLPETIDPALVREVSVEVGALDAVVEDSLTFSFNAIKPDAGMPLAELHVEEINVKCKCRDCDVEFSLDVPVFICPECGRGRVEVLQGRGIRLTKIIVEDPNGEEDGNTSHS